MRVEEAEAWFGLGRGRLYYLRKRSLKVVCVTGAPFAANHLLKYPPILHFRISLLSACGMQSPHSAEAEAKKLEVHCDCVQWLHDGKRYTCAEEDSGNA